MTVIPCWPRARGRCAALCLCILSLSFVVSTAFAGLPTIGGTPPTQAVVGQHYSFVPHASDPEGDRLIFWIQSRPAWITFNWRTGAITGTPGAGNVGVYRNIVMGVSDAPDRARVKWLPAFDLTVTSGGTSGGTSGRTSGSTSGSTSSSSQNRRPVMSGTPPTSVVVGQTYSFQPTARDPDSDTLTFWIQHRPAWATIDRTTGRLYGTPDGGDVGTYADIVISATDGRRNAPLPAFSIAVVPVATGSATLSWTPPTTRTDGSPLTNLAGYRVLWGTTQGSYPNSVKIANPGLSSYVVSNLSPATYYFVVTAFDKNGLESGHSNRAQKTLK